MQDTKPDPYPYAGSHEWARQFQELGHTVRLMAPKFHTPYRKSGKYDGNDAEAICEAVGRPNMRFVPVKSVEAKAVLARHRIRQGYVEERTALINRMRAILALAELGSVLPLGAHRPVCTWQCSHRTHPRSAPSRSRGGSESRKASNVFHAGTGGT